MDDINNIEALQKTLGEASEIIAAFISVTNSNEQPLDSLMQAAEKSLNELVVWQNTVEAIVEVVEQGNVH